MDIMQKLPPAMAERARQAADERETDVDTLALEIFMEYLEELEDLAELREQTEKLKRGETYLLSMEEVHAEMWAMDDMQEYKE